MSHPKKMFPFKSLVTLSENKKFNVFNLGVIRIKLLAVVFSEDWRIGLNPVHFKPTIQGYGR